MVKAKSNMYFREVANIVPFNPQYISTILPIIKNNKA